ncbi:MAG: hypothetical protein GY789_02490 [Hyphomicrobiales bacterium]|nr:hypothetical protein [Hyphomicrobiales bacterium]MCP4997867.1 hypothetical protein [Hyphomicrobiales bacterium]
MTPGLFKFVVIAFLTLGLKGCDMLDLHHKDENFTSSEAVSVFRTGSFQLDMTPDKALPLFTAPGEKLWVPGWNPVVLSGDGFERGTVFVTFGHGHKSYWLVADYDTENHRAVYVRTTPDVDTGTVEVSIVPNGEYSSTVNVTYRMTALSTAGNERLQDAFSEASYADMMKDWRRLISDNKDSIDKHSGE